MTPSKRFHEALAVEKPLQIVGATCAYQALQAEQCGFRALYLSGSGVASASLGKPDLGISTCADVAIDVARLCEASSLPLLVDIDTGWGNVFTVARSVKQIEQAGAAAVHLEDQQSDKRCGHRPNKLLATTQEMTDRIKAAVDGRHHDLAIMARTDALAKEGINSALDRAHCYVEAGAEMIFAEAVVTLADYRRFSEALPVPILANITEFGQTPLFTLDELAQSGVAMVLYPLSAFRAMSQAALAVFKTIRESGSQAGCLSQMQTREALYQTLNYYQYEATLDSINQEQEGTTS